MIERLQLWAFGQGTFHAAVCCIYLALAAFYIFWLLHRRRCARNNHYCPINSFMARHGKMILGLAVSFLFLYMAFGNIDWGKLWGVVRQADYVQIALGSLIVAIMLGIRGHRWGFFLLPAKKIGNISLFWSTSIGFAVNNVLPARLGEVARSYSVHNKSGVPFGLVFGTVVVERLYDTFSILVLFVICLFVMEFPDLTVLTGYGQGTIALILGAMVFVMLFIVVLMKLQTRRMLALAGFFMRPIPQAIREKILEQIGKFIAGLTQSTRKSHMVWIVFLSFSMWIISAFTVWLIIDACHVRLDASQIMVVLMSMVIAVSIPAAPGYAGTYHYLATTAILLVVDIPKEQALAIATLIHAANYIPQTALGLGALFYEGIRVGEVRRAKQALQK